MSARALILPVLSPLLAPQGQVLLLVKPAVWRHARRAAVVRSLVADGATVLTGHNARELRAQIQAAGPGVTVVACGGDGTVHLAVNASAGIDSTLAVVPMGTGNDFARHLGLRGHNAGVAALRAGVVRELDLGRIELQDGTVRYFAGIAWVDEQDLQIVKTYGRATGKLKKGNDQRFPKFETFREQIDGKYWFPVLTRADDTLYFEDSVVRLKMRVKYEDYNLFKGESKIIFGDAVEDSKPQAPPTPPAPNKK